MYDIKKIHNCVVLIYCIVKYLTLLNSLIFMGIKKFIKKNHQRLDFFILSDTLKFFFTHMEFMLKKILSSKFGIVLDGGLFNYEQILHAYHF
jgi:hypothetical protein